MIKNKKIFIFGLARSGMAAAKVLSQYDNDIIVVDGKEQDQDKLDELAQLGAKFILSSNPEEVLDETFDLIVKNPGISYEHNCILKANELGIKVVNEIEVAYNLLPKGVKIIGITGSNGKTTTTTITYEILKKAGLPVHIGGNIGVPLCDMLSEIKENDILVLEISGHQMHDFKNFKTDIAVMTNLYQVHLDFFKTYENYKKHKALLFRHHDLNDVAILNLDNFDVIEATSEIPSKKLYFSNQKIADCYIEDDTIYYKKNKVINTNDIKIKGKHNYENVMCAIMVAKEFSVSNEVIFSVLSTFTGVEHRIEFVKEINKRLFYNDSKSTNTTSTQTALNSFKQPVILILGGLDRGHSFDELVPFMSYVKMIICYGETKYRIKDFADKNNFECHVVDNLIAATNKSYELSNEGDVILLSPACASWDQYKDFEVRGNEFKETVNKI